MVWEWNEIFGKIYVGMPVDCQKKEGNTDNYAEYAWKDTSIKVSCALVRKDIDVKKVIPSELMKDKPQVTVLKSYERTQNETVQHLTYVSYDRNGQHCDGTVFTCPIEDKMAIIIFEWDGESKVDGVRVGRMVDSIAVKSA